MGSICHRASNEERREDLGRTASQGDINFLYTMTLGDPGQPTGAIRDPQPLLFVGSRQLIGILEGFMKFQQVDLGTGM